MREFSIIVLVLCSFVYRARFSIFASFLSKVGEKPPPLGMGRKPTLLRAEQLASTQFQYTIQVPFEDEGRADPMRVLWRGLGCHRL